MFLTFSQDFAKNAVGHSERISNGELFRLQRNGKQFANPQVLKESTGRKLNILILNKHDLNECPPLLQG